jgi:hypothetical protein
VRQHDRATHGIGSTLMLPHQRGERFGISALRRHHKRPFFRSDVTHW